MMNDLQQYVFGVDTDLGSGTGAVGTAFPCGMRIQVVEFGLYISADLEAGAADVAVATLQRTTASQGVSGSEDTAPATSTIATLTGVLTDVDIQDGKCLTTKVDVQLEKGDLCTVISVATPVGGAGTYYMLYRPAGQLAKEDGEQRAGVAAE